MKSTGIVRNIDELGRIVVPKSMRTRMDIKCGDPIEIYIEGDNIILSKFVSHCIICGCTDDIEDFKDKKLCKSCIAEIRNME
jgi:transcriptional pleiotropic regulator of transition state genes